MYQCGHFDGDSLTDKFTFFTNCTKLVNKPGLINKPFNVGYFQQVLTIFHHFPPPMS